MMGARSWHVPDYALLFEQEPVIAVTLLVEKHIDLRNALK